MDDEPKGPIDLQSAKLEDLKGRDLSAGVVARARAPKPTWFVKRLGDGFIFPVEEREAWDIINNHSTWKRHDFAFIGHSDGTTYKRITDESIAGATKLEPEIARMRAEVEKYRAAEEKLIISEAVDMDGDPEDEVNEANKGKVLRLRKILDKQEAKLEELERQHREFSADVVKRATAAELEVAMANWARERVWPDAVNIQTPGASSRERQRILHAMGGRRD